MSKLQGPLYTTTGEDLIRRDICFEAIRLTSLLLEHPVGQSPEVHALLALMLFQSSRFDSRLDNEGNIVLLENQIRPLWNQQAIARGLFHLEQAAVGENLSCYHIEAGIAACHATAPSFAETNWQHIFDYYDLLLEHKNSAIVLLNRAVACGMLNGPEAGAAEVEKLSDCAEFSTVMLFPATLADFYRRLERVEDALSNYRQALGLAKADPEKKFLMKRICELEGCCCSGKRLHPLLLI